MWDRSLQATKLVALARQEKGWKKRCYTTKQRWDCEFFLETLIVVAETLWLFVLKDPDDLP
jgi:hypothetical protein